MALSTENAERLWADRYEKELKNFAFKNRYLNEFQDPEDLFQDLAINVWMKAVDNFKQENVTFSTDVDRSFNSFFTTILNQYLANLAAHRQTGKQEFFRTQLERADRPVGSPDEGGATVLDFLEDEKDMRKVFSESEDFERMANSLDPTLEEVVRFIVENYEPGGKGPMWKEIRQRWGLTQRQLFDQLLEEPEFVDYVTQFE